MERNTELSGLGRDVDADERRRVCALPGQPIESEAGRHRHADEGRITCARPLSTELPGGREKGAKRKRGLETVAARQTNGDAEGQRDSAESGQSSFAPASPACLEIRAWHRSRCYAMEQRKRANLALGSFLRSQLGWRRDLPDAERNAIAKLAADLIKCGEKVRDGKNHELADDDSFHKWAAMIEASIMSRAPWDAVEDEAVQNMKRLATALPAWGEFGEAVRGFGPVSLAVIVGEAGDLSTYPDHSKLWKRMGMAPITKGSATRSGAQWRMRGGLSADDWTEAGYSPRRRSMMFVIGESMVKTQGVYREVYLRRKAYLRDRATSQGLTVAPSAKIPKAKAAAYISDGQIHSQSLHYMEKRLLRDLWKAWRRAVRNAPTGPQPVCPPQTHSAQADLAATRHAHTSANYVLPPESTTSQGVGEARCQAPQPAILGLPPRKSRSPNGAVLAQRAKPKGRVKLASTNSRKRKAA